VVAVPAGRRAGALLERSVALAVAATLAVTVWFMAAAAARHDYDPTTWIVAGSDFGATSRVPADAVRLQGTGYDGQFYYALARDPLALDASTRAALDTPAFRAQRVLLPTLAWAASGGGHPGALDWAIPALNVLAVALLALVVALYARARGASAWFGAGAGLVTGVFMAALRDLTEPLALTALVAALLCHERRRPLAWGALATTACLGRESLVIVVAAVLISDLARRRWQTALAGAGAIVLLGSWQLWLRLHLAHFGVTSSGPDTLAAPFAGPIDQIRTLNRLGILTAPRGLWALAFMLLTALAAGWGLWRAVRRRDELALAFAGMLVLVVVSGPPLWGDAFAFGRTAAPLWLLLVLMAAREPRVSAARLIPALSVALTLGFGIVGGIPRIPLLSSSFQQPAGDRRGFGASSRHRRAQNHTRLPLRMAVVAKRMILPLHEATRTTTDPPNGLPDREHSPEALPSCDRAQAPGANVGYPIESRVTDL
jgi:hypothetical protein